MKLDYPCFMIACGIAFPSKNALGFSVLETSLRSISTVGRGTLQLFGRAESREATSRSVDQVRSVENGLLHPS